MRSALALALLCISGPAFCQSEYGHNGIFPVYEVSGQWTIFDKKKATEAPLAVGNRFLVIGSEGAGLFKVARSSPTYGGACSGHRPLKLHASLLKGPRSMVGRPIIGIHVTEDFTLTGSRAAYKKLPNKVDDATYSRLLPAIRQSVLDDLQAGRFPLKADDDRAHAFQREPKPEGVQTTIDFGSPLALKGASNAFVFVEDSGISASDRRCLRLADGDKLVGDCVEMPRALMAETSLLDFVSYDPSGSGSPFLLAFTKSTPLWGDERWGFVVRSAGPRLFLKDSMDIGCREGLPTTLPGE